MARSDTFAAGWIPERLPNLTGKAYLITGGNSGIGIEAAKMLASAGADIVIACRNPQKAADAVNGIDAVGSGKTESVQLDLSSLASVRSAAAEVRERFAKLDGLVNNAGIMQTPETRTEDGYELQFATNHLGHFLWTGLLIDLLEETQGRVVVVSSIGHKMGRIDFGDLMSTKNYSPINAYTQSKLANLLFALELDRRLRASGSEVSAMACHPGYSSTNLQSTGPTGFWNSLYKVLNPMLSQSSHSGAIPTVLAAAGLEAESGSYYGPRSMGESKGPVGEAKISARARDEGTARKLWQVSEELVDLEWLSDNRQAG